MDYTIHVISDSLGDTAEQVSEAVACQFVEYDFHIIRHSYIQTSSRVDAIFDQIGDEKCIVVFTVIIEKLKNKIIERCVKMNIPYIDVMTSMLLRFSKFLNSVPINKPGYKHQLDNEYFEKIDAIEFAVKYDDGKDARGVLLADCVIIGISRTSKTPLSMYLAHKNIKVTNIPLVPEVEIPKELYQVNPSRIFCLTNDMNVLNKIRRERLRELGLPESSSYADVQRIREELQYGDEIAKKLSCSVINVSDKAIEETAAIIIKKLEELT